MGQRNSIHQEQTQVPIDAQCGWSYNMNKSPNTSCSLKEVRYKRTCVVGCHLCEMQQKINIQTEVG